LCHCKEDWVIDCLVTLSFVVVYEGRRREWFTLVDAMQQPKLHRPEQSNYLALLKHKTNGDSAS